MTSVIRANIWQNSAGIAYNNVIQVLHAQTNTEFIVSVVGGWATIPGLSVTITPRFTTSQILILANIQARVFNNTGDNGGSVRLLRNGGTVSNASTNFYEFGYTTAISNVSYRCPIITYDNPATTSAVTYTVQGGNRSSSNNVHFQDDSAYFSTLTVMEVTA